MELNKFLEGDWTYFFDSVKIFFDKYFDVSVKLRLT